MFAAVSKHGIRRPYPGFGFCSPTSDSTVKPGEWFVVRPGYDHMPTQLLSWARRMGTMFGYNLEDSRLSRESQDVCLGEEPSSTYACVKLLIPVECGDLFSERREGPKRLCSPPDLMSLHARFIILFCHEGPNSDTKLRLQHKSTACLQPVSHSSALEQVHNPEV